MAVAAVSLAATILSQDTDPAQQLSRLRLDIRSLQQALAAGSLPGAQRAFTQFQQDLQAIRPPVNGIQAADSNPHDTTRSDVDTLQKALNSGDLGAAEQAIARLQQDNQKIGAAQRDVKALPPRQAPSALPEPGDSREEQLGLSAEGNGSAKPTLIDVYA